MSLNDLLQRTEREACERAHAAGLREASALARASAVEMLGFGEAARANELEALAILLDARARPARNALAL
jgi:hypothetical protein